MGAIHVIHKGVQFQSRLEAQWARFFDWLKWDWTYEPFDLNGITPSFIISFPAREVLVDVWPTTTIDELHKRSQWVTQSSWHGCALVVGAKLFAGDFHCSGVVGITNDGEADPRWDQAELFLCLDCNGPSFKAVDMNYACRRCHAVLAGGDGHLGSLPGVDLAFASAKNAAQFWANPDSIAPWARPPAHK